MNIHEIIEMIRKDENCKVFQPNGIPELKNGDFLPAEIQQFYSMCGGIQFFKGAEYEFTVVSPKEVVPANPIIVGELCEEDISSQWYIICKDIEDNYITFDSSPERNGRCYDSFWDRHGVVGECSIVAFNFADLLINLYNCGGRELFWLSESFHYLGDAYDD